MIRLGGDSSGLPINWTAVNPAGIVNGFVTLSDNPLQYAVIEFEGRRLLILRGTLVTPTPKPASNVIAVNGVGLPEQPVCAQYMYQTSSAHPSWPLIGRRAWWSWGHSGLNSRIEYFNSGPDVAGEVNDMSFLAAARLL